MMIWDSKYILFVILPGLIIGLWAQMKLYSAYGKYSQVPIGNGMTGAEAARRILDQAGLTDMPVEEVAGHLSDHYDPEKKALFLSSDNYHGRSVAAVGVAAHEAGHALQHLHQDALFNLRMALVPVTQIASYRLDGHLVAGFFPASHPAFPAHRRGHFLGDDLVPTGDLAGGIRCQRAGQGTTIPAGLRAGR